MMMKSLKQDHGPGQLEKIHDSISKITRAESVGNMAQEVEYQPARVKALSSNPSMTLSPHRPPKINHTKSNSNGLSDQNQLV
jgi:hypothetical protein